jgi:TfoX/Sxy family transcriptional regulator of competence genes
MSDGKRLRFEDKQKKRKETIKIKQYYAMSINALESQRVIAVITRLSAEFLAIIIIIINY